MLHAIPRAFSVQINQASQRPKRLAGQTAYNSPQGFLSIVGLAHGNRRLCLLEGCIRGVGRIPQSLHRTSRHHPALTSQCRSDTAPLLPSPIPPPFVVGARESPEWCSIPSYVVSASDKSQYRSLVRMSPNRG